jgi:hypothetical protein
MEPVPRWRILLGEFRELISKIPFTIQFWRVVSYASLNYFTFDIGLLSLIAKRQGDRRRFNLFWFRVWLDSRSRPFFNFVLGGFGIHINTFTGHSSYATLPICYEIPYIGLVWSGMSKEPPEESNDVSRSNNP